MHLTQTKRLLDTTRNLLDNYEDIKNKIHKIFHNESIPWDSPENGVKSLINEWHNLQRLTQSYRCQKSPMIKKLRSITKLLVLYCQMIIIIAANAPGRNMRWHTVWKTMKLYTILVRSTTHIMKARWLEPRLGKIGSNSIEKIKNRLETKDHVVYYICSPITKHAYVGQTKDDRGWQYRIQEEIRTAKRVFYSRKNNKMLGSLRTVDRKMGIIGFFNFIAIPVSRMGSNTTLQYREKIEEDIRRRLQPTMNMKNNPLAHLYWDKTFV